MVGWYFYPKIGVMSEMGRVLLWVSNLLHQRYILTDGVTSLMNLTMIIDRDGMLGGRGMYM